MKPDYQGGGIVNLIASIASGFGATSLYPAADALGVDEIATARNVVLFVIDGLGANYLARVQPEGRLRQCQRATLTSTFPSTTATAITSFMTGLAPQQHGLTGWHMYFREIGAVLAVLPFRPRHGGAPLSEFGLTPARLLRNPSLFNSLGNLCHVVSPAAIVNSPFNITHAGRAHRVGYSKLNGLLTTVHDLVRSAKGRQYVYAYYSELDALAHAHGVESDTASRELASLDRAFGQFLDAIAGSDTLIIVTADHGFIDTQPNTVINLSEHPELVNMLSVPLCGEPRVAYCYLAAGRNGAFEGYVNKHLSHYATTHRSSELIDEGWFGPGVPNSELAGRIGDYTLIMKENYVIRDQLPGEHRHVQIGVHGGISEDEMLVPLMVAQT
jgi:hypothetical protein